MSRVVIATLPKRSATLGMILAATLAVSACQTLGGMVENVDNSANNAMKSDTSASAQLAAVQEVFDANADQVPTLTAVGYAVVSSQPGRSDSQKRLMAIRSARMAAMISLFIVSTSMPCSLSADFTTAAAISCMAVSILPLDAVSAASA